MVIPVAFGDRSWDELLPLLIRECPEGTEIVISATEPPPSAFAAHRASAPHLGMRWITGGAGRGRQLNRGAREAVGRLLWFLHADSRLRPGTIPVLLRRLRAADGTLWYFDLRFLADGPRLMRVNEIGTWVRSELLGLPFGDQGFALSGALFARLGGFSEEAPYGEDHLFVWAARCASVPVRPVGLPLWTSARKFQQHGWLVTTCRHLRLTWQQAVPQFFRMIRTRGESR